MEAIRDAIQNVSLYEVKAAVRKAQNVVMNYTELEAKVREATNNEPWGASSTLMSEIASGTYNYQLLNEIMPMIYRRFNEKTAEEWRQIYKALQLLEYLIKNGAEQVIDDARSHLSTIKMLRQFYYIDSNGKDQGVNVRNRAKELAELLSDVDKIRAERKKARQNKSKYGGVEGGAGGSFNRSSTSGGGRRFGGFGSDSVEYGGYPGSNNGVYGDGGGFGGNFGGFHDDGYGSRSESRNNQKFEEYDEYEDSGARRPAQTRRNDPGTSASTPKAPPPPKKEPEIDLLAGDSGPIPPPPPSNTASLGAMASGTLADDDFDDFQSAPPPSNSTFASFQTTTQTPPPLTSSASALSLVQPKPVSTNQQSGMSSLVGLMSPTASAGSSIRGSPAITPAITGLGMGMPPPMKPMNSTGYQPTQPNYFTSVPVAANNTSGLADPAGSSTLSQPKKPAGGDAFGSIWNQASSGIKKSSTPVAKTPSLQTMAKEKATAGIWGAGPATTPNPPSKPPTSTGNPDGGLDDLLS